MKNFQKLLAILTVFTFLCSCGPGASQSKYDITKTEAIELMSTTPDLLILDVRTPEEWEDGIIDNAIKLNFYDADFRTKVAQLDKEVPVLVYCKSGGRSSNAASIMDELGFKTIYNLSGGYDGYKVKQ